MIQKRSTGDVESYQSCPYYIVNPAPSLALIILPSSHYYHNHIANKIIQQIRQKTRFVLHINHISHHRHRPLSLYCPPHRSSPSSATTYTNKGYHLQLISILQRYIILQRHVVTISNIHRPSSIT